MFSELQQRPADPILGLSVKFKADAKPDKIDLGAGIYKDEAGHTPVLQCVKAAEKYLLEKLFRFSAEIENLRAKVSYRSSATLAYAELVDKRLSELNEDNQKGFQSLGGFLERRFYPAIRTISSVNSRLECLSTRIDRTTDLIRTKVDLELERRSQSLLSSLNNRSHRQYRLQRTIEGLSVVAISYYLVELIKLTVPGSRWLGLELNPDDVAVFTAPLILLSAVIVSGVIRRRLSKEKASD